MVKGVIKLTRSRHITRIAFTRNDAPRTAIVRFGSYDGVFLIITACLPGQNTFTILKGLAVLFELKRAVHFDTPYDFLCLNWQAWIGNGWNGIIAFKWRFHLDRLRLRGARKGSVNLRFLPILAGADQRDGD